MQRYFEATEDSQGQNLLLLGLSASMSLQLVIVILLLVICFGGFACDDLQNTGLFTWCLTTVMVLLVTLVIFLIAKLSSPQIVGGGYMPVVDNSIDDYTIDSNRRSISITRDSAPYLYL